MISKGSALDVPPPGAGLTTVTLATPTVAMSAAATIAITCVLLTKMVVRAAPSESLEARLGRLEQYIPACRERLERVRRRHQKHLERYQAESKAGMEEIEFPKSYAHATYETLAPLLQMGGFVVEHRDCIEVFLDGFWQSAKQRELKEIVDRCNAQQFTAPDGRALRFGTCPKPGHI